MHVNSSHPSQPLGCRTPPPLYMSPSNRPRSSSPLHSECMSLQRMAQPQEGRQNEGQLGQRRESRFACQPGERRESHEGQKGLLLAFIHISKTSTNQGVKEAPFEETDHATFSCLTSILFVLAILLLSPRSLDTAYPRTKPVRQGKECTHTLSVAVIHMVRNQLNTIERKQSLLWGSPAP